MESQRRLGREVRGREKVVLKEGKNEVGAVLPGKRSENAGKEKVRGLPVRETAEGDYIECKCKVRVSCKAHRSRVGLPRFGYRGKC